MPDIIIQPNRNTTNNPIIYFVGLSAGNNLTPSASSIYLTVLPEGQIAFLGSAGSLFSITDSLTGVLMSVGDTSGLPILEVTSDDKVVMGAYNTNALVVSGARVGVGREPGTYTLSVSGDVDVTGNYRINGVINAGNTKTLVTQAAHGFVAGDVLRRSSGSYAKAQANSVANAEVVGVVESVTSSSQFTLVTQGVITGLTGLTDSTEYFLSPTTAGLITSTEPTSVGQISKPVLVATSTTTGIVVNMRGIEIASSYGTMSSQNASGVAITGGTISGVSIAEKVYSLAYAATITPDVANGNVQLVTLTGNVTFNAFANAIDGQSLTLIVTQDGSGNRLLSSTMKFAGGSKTLSTTAGAIDTINVVYASGTYYASLVKGYA